ncbi:MAG: carboxypeptidase regulatory-like domain-containing protein, partial [Terriglobia bacterium]
SITGFVTDPSGAVVPNATVTALLTQQGLSRRAESNAQGFYNFVAMLPGSYTLTVEKTGFERLTRTGLTLTVNQNLRVDMKLKVGAVTQGVTVHAQGTMVNTQSPTLSGLVDDRRVVDLPLNGRNVLNLSGIVPGVLSVSAPEALTCARAGTTMDVNGGQFNMNNYLFDGAYFVQPSRNTAMNFPPPDAIQEFRIQTSNFSAEYGRNAGSQVTVVSKSGTNAFHGSAWEFLRNEKFNSRDFFAAGVPGLKQNQFGAAAGGPIKKNKIFFFGSYQGLTDRPQAVENVVAVPSAAERTGDFSALLPGTVLTDPVSPLTGLPYVTSTGGPCIVNNIIHPTCINPGAKSLLQFVPQSATGSVVSLGPNPTNNNNFFGRIDINQSAKNHLFGHVYVDHTTETTPTAGCGNLASTYGYIGENFVEETDMVTLNDTYIVSPHLINQGILSYLRTTSNEFETKTITPSQLGIDMPQYIPTGALEVNVSGSFALGSGFNTRFINNNYEVRDMLDWMKDNHEFKFGGEFMRLHFIQRFIGSPGFNFTGQRTGAPLADFMVGAYTNLSMQFGVAQNDGVQEVPSLFFQDQYKPKPRLTLTYGLRWEPMLPWYDQYNRLLSVKPGQQSTVEPDAPPGFLFPGDPGIPRGLVPNRLENFAPRAGFAWDVFGNGNTSVRGGYGVFFDSIKADAVSEETPPWVGTPTYTNGLLSDPFASVGAIVPPVVPSGHFGCVRTSAFPGINCPLFPPPYTPFVTSGSLTTPYFQAWNLTLERQITPSVMLEGGYVGKIGTHIEAYQDFNPAYFETDPFTGAPPSANNYNDRVKYEPGILTSQSTLDGTNNRSWYNSLQVQATKRFSKGFSVIGSYTLAKSIDYASYNVFGNVYADPFDLHDNRGRSNWDRRNAVVASYLWSPPIKFSKPWKNTLLGGWTFSGITTVQSGEPFTVQEGEDVALIGTGTALSGYQYADRNGQPVTISHPNRGAMISEFFNTNAFVPVNLVPPGYIGDSGRNTISGPALSNTDVAAIKNFAFRERYRIEFRAEAFNVFNQVNFGNPLNSVNGGPGVFGTLPNASAGRIFQFALKFLW